MRHSVTVSWTGTVWGTHRVAWYGTWCGTLTWKVSVRASGTHLYVVTGTVSWRISLRQTVTRQVTGTCSQTRSQRVTGTCTMTLQGTHSRTVFVRGFSHSSQQSFLWCRHFLS